MIDPLILTTSSHYTCRFSFVKQNQKSLMEALESIQPRTNRNYKNLLLLNRNKSNYLLNNRHWQLSRLKRYFFENFQKKIQVFSRTLIGNFTKSLFYRNFNFCVICNSTTKLVSFLCFLLILFSLSLTSATPAVKSNLVVMSSVNLKKNITLNTQVDTSTSNAILPHSDQNILVKLSSKTKRSLRKKRRNRKRKSKKRKDCKRKKGKNKGNRKNCEKHPNHSKKDEIIPLAAFQPNLIDFHTPNLLPTSSVSLKRLYNKNGNSFHLAVWRNGKVSGEKSDIRSRYSILEIRGVGKGGIVTIKGIKSKKYICTSKKGKVKARKRFKHSRCRFREQLLSNHQNTYESLSCRGCYLNINKQGKVKRLNKANPKLVQAHFLPRKISRRTPRHNLSSDQIRIQSASFTVSNETQNPDTLNSLTESKKLLRNPPHLNSSKRKKALLSKPRRNLKKQGSKKRSKKTTKKRTSKG